MTYLHTSQIHTTAIDFMRHVVTCHPTYTFAKPRNNDAFFIDKDGETWWKSEAERSVCEGFKTRKKEYAEFSYNSKILQPGIMHFAVSEHEPIKNARVYKCSCGETLPTGSRKNLKKDMKIHVMSHHWKPNHTIFVTMIPTLTGARQKTLKWANQWIEVDPFAALPPEQDEVVTGAIEGSAPLAREIVRHSGKKAREICCSLCGRVFESMAKGNKPFLQHTKQYHTLPIVLEYHDGSRQLVHQGEKSIETVDICSLTPEQGHKPSKASIEKINSFQAFMERTSPDTSVNEAPQESLQSPAASTPPADPTYSNLPSNSSQAKQ